MFSRVMKCIIFNFPGEVFNHYAEVSTGKAKLLHPSYPNDGPVLEFLGSSVVEHTHVTQRS